MRVFLPLLFLTLVLSSFATLAAPQTTTTLETTPLSAEDDPLLATVDPSMIQARSTFLLSASLGFAGGNYLEGDEYQQGPLFALRYMPLKDSLPAWDYQIEVNNDNFIGISVGRRWYCCPEEVYMPYVRASANMFVDGSDEIGGLVEIRRLRLRGSIGVGETFISEFGVGYAITGPDLFAQFGYAFSF